MFAAWLLLNRRSMSNQHLSNQDGIALLTSLMAIIALAVIGVGAITVSAMGNRLASHTNTNEGGATAAEGCIGVAVNIIQDTLSTGTLPEEYLNSAVPPGPVSDGPVLQKEILGQDDRSSDLGNTKLDINSYKVTGDIDRLYASPRAGAALQFAGGYEGTAGGAAAGGVDLVYRIDCTATHTDTATSARITVIYTCTLNGESCQRRPS